MIATSRFPRPTLVAIGVAATLVATPCFAQGFFDQLFGGGTPAPSQPSYSYDQPGALDPGLDAPVSRPRPRKRVAREVTPVRQKTTDLMHDKTLHVGDAVMMKDGLHIYSGGSGSTHVAKQFVPIDRSDDVSKKERAALVAMDTTRNDPLKKGIAPDTIASGRSAAVSTPISKGFKITDARGQSVRYVGP